MRPAGLEVCDRKDLGLSDSVEAFSDLYQVRGSGVQSRHYVWDAATIGGCEGG